MGLAVGLLALLWLLLLAATLHLWAIQAELVPFIRQYVYAACWSLPAFAVVMASRNVCEATGLTRPVMVVQLLGLLINTLASAHPQGRKCLSDRNKFGGRRKKSS